MKLTPTISSLGGIGCVSGSYTVFYITRRTRLRLGFADDVPPVLRNRGTKGRSLPEGCIHGSGHSLKSTPLFFAGCYVYTGRVGNLRKWA